MIVNRVKRQLWKDNAEAHQVQENDEEDDPQRAFSAVEIPVRGTGNSAVAFRTSIGLYHGRTRQDIKVIAERRAKIVAIRSQLV